MRDRVSQENTNKPVPNVSAPATDPRGAEGTILPMQDRRMKMNKTLGLHLLISQCEHEGSISNSSTSSHLQSEGTILQLQITMEFHRFNCACRPTT